MMMKMSIVVCLLLAVVCGSVNASLVPTHIYLSLTGIATQTQVTFTTTSPPTNAQVVYWSKGSSNVPNTTIDVVESDITVFKRPITSAVNYIISVTLQNLLHNQQYQYQIVGDTNDAGNTTSNVSTFKHIPAISEPVTLGIYGDLGAYGYALMKGGDNGLPSWAAKGKFDIVLHNGDLAYNLGTDQGKVGDAFMNHIESITSIVPYIVTPGNHEFMNWGEDEKYYKNLWAGQVLLGKNSKSSNPTMWFSFDIGTVHIIGISTEVYCEDFANVGIQYAWLENDLNAAYNRSPRPWIVVLGHRPLYQAQMNHLHSRLMREGLRCTDETLTSCTLLKPCDGGEFCAYSIEALLEKYEVDMFNAGHVHSYIRHNPILTNTTFLSYADPKQYINPKTTVHIISGAAGTQQIPEPEPLQEGAFDESIAVVDSTVHSFSTLTAYNNSHLYYQQISAEDGTIIDDFWIIKSDDVPTPSFKLVPFTFNDNHEFICDQ